MKIDFGIDCGPGMPRSNVYAEMIFDRLGIEPIPPYSKLFGAWKWKVEVYNYNYQYKSKEQMGMANKGDINSYKNLREAMFNT